MKKIFLLFVCLLSINAPIVLSQTNDDRLIWQFRGLTPLRWYSSGFEACAASEFFLPRIQGALRGDIVNGVTAGSGWFNPRIGEPGSAGVRCYGSFIAERPSGNITIETLIGFPQFFRCSVLLDRRPPRPPAEPIVQHLCRTPDTDTPDENQGGTCNEIGNPCNTATGNKVQTETDFTYGDLSFVRTYNSQNLVDIGLGRGWRTNYQAKLTISDDRLVLVSKSGKGEPWSRVNGQWQGDLDTDLIVEQDGSQFTVTYPNDRSERYNANGQLEMQTDSNGFNTIYTYNQENQLIEVENHYGKKVSFSYRLGRIEQVTDPQGVVYRYEYDGLRNLVAVVFPDLTPDDNSDNPRRVYHYENENFLGHLTGITDENGDRYATWSYDSEGRAISSEHAQTTNSVGQEKVELDFQ